MPKKILFIEDESALQKTFRDLLESEGYEMLSALDGEAGLNLAKNEKPDLVLLDLVLPRVHGFDVLKQLKQNEQTKEVPVIVLTNLEDIKDVDRAIELGATTYLVKASYGPEEIVRKIKETLRQ